MFGSGISSFVVRQGHNGRKGIEPLTIEPIKPFIAVSIHAAILHFQFTLGDIVDRSVSRDVIVGFIGGDEFPRVYTMTITNLGFPVGKDAVGWG